MDTSSLVAALCVAISFMFVSCASDQKSLQQYGKSAVEQAELTLPRRLKLQEVADVKSSSSGSGEKDIMVQKKLLEGSAAAAGEKRAVENVKRNEDARKRERGTWREWTESPNNNKSDYFTMDYSWVRRRRPIHNKQIPFVP